MLNLTTFQNSLQELNATFKKNTFLLAISGGPDSMVLFDLFKKADLIFQVAHLNYKLRGEDSTKDEQLVKNICKKNNINFHLYQVSEIDQKPINSIQEWARNLRYDFFRRIQKNENLDFIVTAHHLNDQLETFIINLSKASGIKGLSGIPANDNFIFRPLLHFSKDEIYQYANENEIEFREDLSNQKNDYLRNKIRNVIVPNLLETNDHFLKNFGKSIFYLNQTKNFVEDQIFEIEKNIITREDHYSFINKELFQNQTEFVQFEILRKFGFHDVKEIAKIGKAETGKKFISNEYHLTIDRENYIVKRIVDLIITQQEEEIILELNSENQIIFPENFHQEIKELGKLNWKIDGDKIRLPLKLRHKKDGDLFHPMGMMGKKKISKFFKDEKIPILAQQKIWILCDGDDQVLGVIPYRQDRRFAASKESLSTLETYSPK